MENSIAVVVQTVLVLLIAPLSACVVRKLKPRSPKRIEMPLPQWSLGL